MPASEWKADISPVCLVRSAISCSHSSDRKRTLPASPPTPIRQLLELRGSTTLTSTRITAAVRMLWILTKMEGELQEVEVEAVVEAEAAAEDITWGIAEGVPGEARSVA